MTLHHDTRPLSIDRMGPDDLVETFAFLDRDPVLNVYLAALVITVVTVNRLVWDRLYRYVLERYRMEG